VIFLRSVALTAFFFIPGFLAVSLLRRDRGSVNINERLLLVFVLGVGIVSLEALMLALASIYSLINLLILVCITCSLMLALARGRISWIMEVRISGILVILAFIIAGLVLFAPPGRTVFGWSDVGVYPNISAYMEREGGVVIEAQTVREIDPEHRSLVYDSTHATLSSYEALENKNYFITDFDNGAVISRFYFLWPSLMAVFASFLGLESMFWAITAVAILGLWSFFLLSRRLLGRRWGIVALLLLSLTPLMVYFARYATSEMMNMMLFISASLCLTVYLDMDKRGVEGKGRGMAVIAAFLFFLGFLCRIDFLLTVPPLAVFFLAKRTWEGMTPADWWFYALTITGAITASIIGMIFSTPYFDSLLGFRTKPLDYVFSLKGAAVAAYVLIFLFAVGLRGIAKRIARIKYLWAILLWSCLAGLFVYLYYIRPGTADSIIYYGVINASQGSSYINQTLVRWAWYFSFTGLILIFLGYGIWFTRRRSFSMLPVVMTGAFMTLIYVTNMRCTPIHILVMRRLVPVILPIAALVVTYILKSLAEGIATVLQRKKQGKVIGMLATGALLAYLLLFQVNASIPIFGLEEGGNQLEICGDIAHEVEENSVVIMDYHLGDLYGPPLRSIYGVENAWILDNSTLSEGEFMDLIVDLGYPERPIYLLWRPEMSGAHVPMPDGPVLGEAVRLISWEETLEKSFEERPKRRVFDSEEIWLMRLSVR